MNLQKIDEFGLTLKKRKFVEEYLKDLDPKKAALRSGYESEYGHALLSRPDVQQAITEIQKEILDKNHMSLDEAVSHMTKIARTTTKDFYKVDNGRFKIRDDISDEALEAIQEVKVTKDGEHLVKPYSRTEALNNIIQRHGGFVQKHEHSGPDGKPIKVIHSDADVDRLISKMDKILEGKRIKQVKGEVIDVVPKGEESSSGNTLSEYTIDT